MPHDSDSKLPKPDPSLGIDTLVVQGAIHDRFGSAKPFVQPIVPSIGFTHPTMADMDQAFAYQGGETPADANCYVYARYGAPNASALEEAVALLEGARGAVSFASGMAALHAAMLALVPHGSTVVAAEQLYGITRTMLGTLSTTMGLQVHFVDFSHPDKVRHVTAAVRPSCLLCEVLTNPLVRVIQIGDIAEIARKAQARLLVDNTFATPFLIKPLELGADIVVHSTTKYLNGHGDVLGGIALGSAELMQIVNQHRRVLGAMPSAFDAWLALRGLRTFALRMRQACTGAQQIAHWLAGQKPIKRVYYPGLPGDDCYEKARSMFRSSFFGAMIAFEVKNLDRTGAFALVESLRLVKPVTSLGDIYSLILHPASTSHRWLTAEQREAQGITEGTLRLSIGIEDPADLIRDLDQALQHVTPR
jgi:cystathionine beta-lyase/cystathionine gamma-synthase